MRRDVSDPGIRSLLDGPSAASLTIHRGDGEAVVSPVWFRVHDDAFEIVVAATDAKLPLLRHDPRCVLLVFEAVPPFRGVMVRGEATLAADDGSRARRAIATRYLGPDGGAAYADLSRRPPGVVVRLPLQGARAWDLADRMP